MFTLSYNDVKNPVRCSVSIDTFSPVAKAVYLGDEVENWFICFLCSGLEYGEIS